MINHKFSIDTVEKVMIGGIEQVIAVRSRNVAGPIILFLHGGPGTAQIASSRKSQQRLEEYYIVVNWDQRGAGGSYSASLQTDDFNIERFVLDTEELVLYLLESFNQQNIFLVGHSWGSIIGMKFAKKWPDLLRAYIGVGQVVDMEQGEMISYRFALEEATKRGNKKAIAQLTRIGEPPYNKISDGGIQRKWLAKFNGVTYKGSLLSLLLKNISFKDLRHLKLIKFIKGSIFSIKHLEDEMNQINFMHDTTEIDVPVYFCLGRRDYNVPFELVELFYTNLQAPHKEIVWFEQSGHAPNYEEVDKFEDFCISLLETDRGEG